MNRIPELTGLRGAAFLWVFLFHTMRFHSDDLFSLCGNAIFRSGWLGVDLFFVLSGFLITRILLDYKLKSSKYKLFYGRRVLRIFPIYYLVLCLVFFISPFLTDIFVDLRHMGPYFFTYTYNFWVVFHEGWAKDGALDHFWSLCIEEQFYLFWPFIVFHLKNRALRKACILIFFFSLLFKVCLASQLDKWSVVYVLMPCRLDGFALGAFVSTLYYEVSMDRCGYVKGFFCLTGMVILISGVVLNGFYLRDAKIIAFSTPIFSLFFALILYMLLTGKDNLAKKFIRCRTLMFFGKYSYGLYVYHYILWYVITTHFQFAAKGFVTSAMVMAVSLPISVLSYHQYEKRFLKIRDHIVG